MSRWDVSVDHNTILFLYFKVVMFPFLCPISIYYWFILFILIRFRHPTNPVFDLISEMACENKNERGVTHFHPYM